MRRINKVIGRVWENHRLELGEGVERKENGGQVLERMVREGDTNFLKREIG